MENPPHPKRLKIAQRGEDDYVPGNIIEIEIHNFMTYNHLKCKPGSRLNLVIGPNGSGKSSLVCAIALGLAGEPQLLGRAASVGAYVKRGEESGYIKISLRGSTPEEKICITRKIDIHNKSDWQINGKAAPKRDVLDVIQRFNIQVGNLTQFLPQDRVSEFAKLSPVQLLEETEKAVGDPQLPVHHRALVEKSRELKKLEVTVKQNGDTLNQLKVLNAEQEKDVERVRQREQLLLKAESMKKKLPWLKYDMKKVEYLEAKEQEKAAKKKLDEAIKRLNDLMKPIEEKKEMKAKQESLSMKVSNLMNQNAKKRLQLLENESHLSVQVRGKYDEVEDLRKREEHRQTKIAKAKEDLVAAQQELARLPPFEPPKEKIETLASQIVELQLSANQKRLQRNEKEHILNQKKGSLNQCISRLKEMENTNNKLLQALRNSGAEKIFEAYEWLQRHQSELRGNVYGPVLLEVNIPNKVHATYLEGQVPNYVWKSFITQDPADRDLLVKNLKPFEIPVLNYVGEANSQRMPPEISGKMRELGITARLDQVFVAPHAVKEVLTSQFGLDYSFIGSSKADQRADEVTALGIYDLWTPESHYRWTTSRYGGHVSATMEPVNASRLFLCNLDAREVDNLKSRKRELEETICALEDNLKALVMEQRHVEDEAARLQKLREEIVDNVKLEKKKRRDLEIRIDQRRRNLESLEAEDDLETVTQKLMHKVSGLNTQRFKVGFEIKDLLLEAVSFRRSFTEKNLAAIELDMKERSVSTILYLVSLQDLTNCPFRVVDEINQGMDPVNERKMFQQLVRAASQPNTPQCFLLTPKLLPHLEYSQACSILNIMNGPWIEKPSKAWASGGCWGEIMGLAGK